MLTTVQLMFSFRGICFSLGQFPIQGQFPGFEFHETVTFRISLQILPSVEFFVHFKEKS